MRRFLISLLSLAALVIPATSWEASTSSNLAINVTAGQAITGVSLSNSSFTGGAASGTVVGAISVTMSPASPAFSGSLSLSGTNASSFQIVGSNLETNEALAAGTYNVNIVASETGVTGSPFTQAETITGTSATTSAFEDPGPSYALWNAPYYSCGTNYYVNHATGSNSNDGLAPTTGGGHGPWQTIPYADGHVSESGPGAWCVHVAAGTYPEGLSPNMTEGGTNASSTGYLVYRCDAPGADHNLPGNGGGFSGGGCQITDGGNSVCSGTGSSCSSVDPNYLAFDGFSFNAGTSYNQYAAAFHPGPTGAPTTADGATHWIIVNNVITGYGLGGIQQWNSEWWFVTHNLIYANSENSGCDAGSQGSGISFATPAPLASYTETADDLGPTPKLGIYGSYTSSNPNPFHQYILWNVVYNNHVVGCSDATDGNGIIIDTGDDLDLWGVGVNYPHRTLIAFNIVYNNGGSGIINTSSSWLTVANNTCYNNNLVQTNEFGCIVGNWATNESEQSDVYLNNIAVVPQTTGQSPFVIGTSTGQFAQFNGGSCGWSIGCGGNNISWLQGGSAPENPTYPGNPGWSCTTNKCMTLPGWVNVGNSSIGNANTQPLGTNFAPQSNSPAIGYAVSPIPSYLPAQASDAGACYHALTSCP
jgi:hypothetical protein